jgi:hypothetical protein
MSPQIKKLIAERDRLAGEMQAMQAKLHGLNYALSTLTGEDMPGANGATPGRRKNVKATVFQVIQEAPEGLTAAEIVEKGAAKGVQLDRQSVATLLSVQKKAGALVKDGDRYKMGDPTKAASTGRKRVKKSK